MAGALSSAPLILSKPVPNPGNNETFVRRQNLVLLRSWSAAKRLCIVKAKADDKKEQSTKPKSVICGDCDGNGAVLCSQCKGGGVNTADFFNGQFKAGAKCWLCGGKKEMLCGNCNGAGFIGGFMSTFDE